MGEEEQSFQALSSLDISISRNLHGFSCQTLHPAFLGFMEASLQMHDSVNHILNLSVHKHGQLISIQKDTTLRMSTILGAGMKK
jgi:hypothetical protein